MELSDEIEISVPLALFISQLKVTMALQENILLIASKQNLHPILRTLKKLKNFGTSLSGW